MNILFSNLDKLVSASSLIKKADLHPKAFGRVAVLFGGGSGEREISLQSGRAILAALLRRGIDAFALEPDENCTFTLVQKKVDRVFIALHGRGGEDGVVQGLLTQLGIPFTGSGVAASALAMDKPRSKLVMHAMGVPTLPFGFAKTLEQGKDIAERIGLPLVVKPSGEGSSLGVTPVFEQEAFAAAFEKAAFYGEVMIEPWVEGRHFFVSILGETVLPVAEVQAEGLFYDYNAKYLSDTTKYLCPAPLSQGKAEALQALAYRAFLALGCEGWGRVDFVQDKKQAFWALEANTIPGMTPHSLLPLSAHAAGMEFDELVLQILGTTLPEKMHFDARSTVAKV